MAQHEAYLRTALAKYTQKDLVKRDCMNIFQHFPDLRPSTDFFVFNDGSRRELLCLEGTIPVNYKGATYNIPVCLWLLESHPYNPPMVFVKPTSTMQIKQGKHVDTNGRVFLPYLHEWRHPQSDMMGLIQVMTIVFGEEPPVFARSQTGPARPPYPPGGQPAGGRLPYPTGGPGYGMPQPNAAGSTPYSAYNAPASTSYPASSTAGGYPGAGYTPGGYANPYPGYPPSGGYNPVAGQTSYPQQAATTHTSTSSTQGQSSNQLSDEQIKASVLSAVEDKMRRRLKEIFAQAQAEMDALKKTQEDLNAGKAKLEEMVGNLEKEQIEVEKNISLLREKDEEIMDVLARMENREAIDIDEAVVAPAPLYKQLLNSFAEEQAIEDTIYYLGTALNRGSIDLDVFLKKVRELSRQQFMLRALIRKCRSKAGLPEI
ncbi:unnamed protein product [Owenia fusiformis]|uniref:Uncharacterized protein n=1 Tax=Owenia fusiformis TaxID=6347 RepID=A0A8J1XJM6_OWEFU|nr:unnamed protein product [Owenia fusiformis]